MSYGFDESRARKFGAFRRQLYVEMIEAIELEQHLTSIAPQRAAHTPDAKQANTLAAELRDRIDDLQGVEADQRAAAVRERMEQEANSTWEAFNQDKQFYEGEMKAKAEKRVSAFAEARAISEK